MYAVTEFNPLYATIIFLLTTSLGQTLFAAILLLLPKQGDRTANLFLSLFMLGLSLCLSTFFLIDFWQILFPHSILITEPIFFILPPLIWFYINALTQYQDRVRLKNILIHFSPAFVVAISLIPFYQLTGIEKLEWYYFRNDDYVVLTGIQQWVRRIITPLHLVAIIFGLVYVVMCYQRLKVHSKQIENQFSNTDFIRLVWLKYLLISCGFIYIITALTYIIGFFKEEVIILWILTVSTGCVLLSVFGYFGVNQRYIYNSKMPPMDSLVVDNTELSEIAGEQKYKNSALSAEHVEILYQELLEYMQEHQPFLNPDLTIQHLADKTGIAARDLSRIINERGKKNFMEFINAYRIKLAMQKLTELTEASVLDIAMEVGFNSKSSFYEAFKRVTQTTPLAFKKQLTAA